MTPYFITIWLMQVSEMRWCWDQYLWCSSGAQGGGRPGQAALILQLPLLPVTASRTSTTEVPLPEPWQERSHPCFSNFSVAFCPSLCFFFMSQDFAHVFQALQAVHHGGHHSRHIGSDAPGQSWLRVSTDFLFSFLDRINITHRIKAHHWARRLKTNTTQSHRTSAYPYPWKMDWIYHGR